MGCLDTPVGKASETHRKDAKSAKSSKSKSVGEGKKGSVQYRILFSFAIAWRIASSRLIYSGLSQSPER